MIDKARSYLSSPGLGPAIVKAVLSSAGVRVLGMMFGFLVGVQLARGLGADGYGVYGLAVSIIALLTVPSEFGLPQLVTREVAAGRVRDDWSAVRGALQWATRVSLSISALLCVGLLCWLLVVSDNGYSPLALTLMSGLLLVPIVAAANIHSAALRGLQFIVQGQIPDTLIRPATFSVLLLFAILTFGGLTPLLAMFMGVAAALFSLAVALVLFARKSPAELRAAQPSVPRRGWWGSAVPMAMTEGMRVLQSHSVIIALGIMSTASVVGVFRVASAVALIFALPISLINIVTAPLIARLFAQDDRHRLRRLLGWSSLVMLLGTALLIAPFLMAGSYLLELIFGFEFRGADLYVLILGGGVLANAFFGATATLLNMTGQHRRVTRASVISLFCLLFFLPIFIVAWGAVGAATVSSLALGGWNFLMWRDAKTILRLDTSPLSLLGTRSFRK